MKTFFGKIGKAIATHKIVTIAVALILVLVVVFSCLGAFIFNRYSQGTVPSDSDLKALKDSGQVYEHVVIFGVDGAGGYFGETDTPNFDKIFKDGSVTYKGMSQFPTISAQNWGSMIHGVRCQKHKITNDLAANQNYSDTKYPSFFKVYGERHPDAEMASIVNWGPINKGIVEHNIPGMYTKDAKVYYPDAKGDEAVDEAVCDLVIDFVKTKKSEIVFMQFDGVDGAGHDGNNMGYGAPEFEAAVKHIDVLMGKIYQAYCDRGWKDNTLFICVSDHGHECKKGGGHGSNNPTVRNVTVAVAGGKGNVIKGEPGTVITQDIASIVLYALGEKQPDSWDSKVPKNMFKGL